MHDPNFEKTVQQKMEELLFQPAESVWVNIEKAVAGQRHRRGLPYFWRFALPVFLAAAATGVYYFSARRADESMRLGMRAQSVSRQAVAPVGAGAATSTNTTVPGVEGSATTAAGASATAGSQAVSLPVSAGTIAAKTANSRADIARTRNNTPVRSAANPNIVPVAPNNSPVAPNNSPIAPNNYPIASGAAANRRAKAGLSSSKAGVPGGGTVAQETVAQENTQAETGETILTVIEPQKSHKAWFYQPELADQRQEQAIRAARLNKKATIAIARIQQKSRPWEAGFVGGGGISRLNRLNGAQATAAVSNTAASFYTINGSSSGKAYISDVRSDPSFFAGVYLQKAVANRLTFNTGIMVHYYSSRITIGQQVVTYVQSSASFLNPTAPAALASAAAYSAGDRQVYTNKYYFLELPLNLQWKVNQNRLLPLFLEGGFSLSRLMSANALLYDSETGVYSKEGNDINKTQLYVSSALMAGLPIHGLHIQVGPQVQYGLTPIVDGHSLGDQHFFYAGIKMVVIPGKK
jgi:Outer membrane protein beta-barrel domain